MPIVNSYSVCATDQSVTAYTPTAEDFSTTLTITPKTNSLTGGYITGGYINLTVNGSTTRWALTGLNSFTLTQAQIFGGKTIGD